MLQEVYAAQKHTQSLVSHGAFLFSQGDTMRVKEFGAAKEQAASVLRVVS